MTCSCGSADTREQLAPDGPHYAKQVCAGCERFIRWVPKPDGEKTRRPASHRELVRKYGNGYCEFCLTPEDKLPLRQTLEGHHIIPYENGGSDERGNVQILCTACHKLAHLIRTHYRSQVTV